MTDAAAVEELVNHRYFQPHVTPVQLFNRATEAATDVCGTNCKPRTSNGSSSGSLSRKTSPS